MSEAKGAGGACGAKEVEEAMLHAGMIKSQKELPEYKGPRQTFTAREFDAHVASERAEKAESNTGKVDLSKILNKVQKAIKTSNDMKKALRP